MTSDSTPAQVAKAVELLSGGSLPMDRLATHVMGLEGIHKAYELMQSGESLRVVLNPWWTHRDRFIGSTVFKTSVVRCPRKTEA